MRDAVLGATLELLSSRGYDFSIDDVAAAAGVHKTTVYRNWSTKAALVTGAVDRLAAEHVPVSRSDDPIDDLRELARSVAAALRSAEGTRTLRAVIAAVAHDAELEGAAAAFFERRYQLAVELVHEAEALGLLRADTDPLVMWQAIVNPLHMRALLGDPASDDDAERLVQLVVHGAAA